MLNSSRDYELSILVKKIKSFNFNGNVDPNQIMNLSKFIFEEWTRIRSKNRNNILKISKKINKELFAKYEAEEEIIIGLLFLLQEKMINFINYVNQR